MGEHQGEHGDQGAAGDIEGRDQSRDLIAGELTPATLRAIGLRAEAVAAEIRTAYARIDTLEDVLPGHWGTRFRLRLDTAAEEISGAANELTRSATDLARHRTKRADAVRAASTGGGADGGEDVE